MRVPKRISHNGEAFYLQSSGRYYQSGRKDSDERLLHRRIWIDAHGPIPQGSEIHHRDGDWTNNNLANLELVPIRSHKRSHTLARWQDNEDAARMRAALEKACDAARAWHASPEGLRWHSEHGVASWANRGVRQLSCEACGKPFTARRHEVARFCSRACNQKVAQRSYFTDERSCAYCGGRFMANRHRKARFCSKRCSNRARMQ